jgi:hypothetical protein
MLLLTYEVVTVIMHLIACVMVWFYAHRVIHKCVYFKDTQIFEHLIVKGLVASVLGCQYLAGSVCVKLYPFLASPLCGGQ